MERRQPIRRRAGTHHSLPAWEDGIGQDVEEWNAQGGEHKGNEKNRGCALSSGSWA